MYIQSSTYRGNSNQFTIHAVPLAWPAACCDTGNQSKTLSVENNSSRRRNKRRRPLGFIPCRRGRIVGDR